MLAEFPAADIYELTELGRTLIETLGALGSWAVSNRGRVEKARATFDAKEKKKGKVGLSGAILWGRRTAAVR